MNFLDNIKGQPSMKRFTVGILLCTLLAVHAMFANNPEALLILAKGDQWLIGGLMGLSVGEYFSKEAG